MKKTNHTAVACLAIVTSMTSAVHAAEIDVVATQTVNNTAFGTNVRAITTNTTWFKNNAYILKDKVFVTNGATLTIEPGTKIYSTLDTKGTTTKNDDAFGSVVITRGAKIQAAGTAQDPIVFTTTDELEFETQTDIDGDTFVAEKPTYTTYGRWGGVVMLGNARIGRDGLRDGTRESRIEGFQPAASADLDADGRADVIEYGGNNDSDNSGTISYVVIRHGGYVYDVATNSEINGLTLGGVGNGTTINHVEVFANADDGIEFFGGSVNTNNISLVFNQDDSFDIDEGYNGINQFWFCVQTPFAEDGVASGHDNGGEWDGVTGTISDSAANSTPTIYNATFIGSGTSALAGNDKGNNAIFLDDRMRGFVYNSVFDDFARDLVGAASDGFGTGLTFGHNTVGRFGGGAYTGTAASNLSFVSDSQAANTFYNGSGNPLNGNSNGGTNPGYRAYSRNGSNVLSFVDPRPSTTSPLLVSNGATLQSGAPVATTYRGAFGDSNWTAGWTTASQLGLITGEVVSGSGSAPFADADGDGISDTLEATTALTSLGFSSAVNNVTGTNLFSSLYSATSIQNISADDIVVQKVGNSVTLRIPVESSANLVPPFTYVDDAILTIPNVTADKQFYRFRIPAAN